MLTSTHPHFVRTSTHLSIFVCGLAARGHKVPAGRFNAAALRFGLTRKINNFGGAKLASRPQTKTACMLERYLQAASGQGEEMKTLVSFILFILSISLKGQSDKTQLLSYYTWGNAPKRTHRDSCSQSLSKKFGFVFEVKAGCIVRSGQARRWTKHNKKVDDRMTRKFGDDWINVYKAELENCQNSRRPDK